MNNTMKQRLFLLLFAAFQLFATNARADEGMWLLHMLQRINEAEMQEMGLNLSAEDIYSLNQACLKDAVITLSVGVTLPSVSDPRRLCEGALPAIVRRLTHGLPATAPVLAACFAAMPRLSTAHPMSPGRSSQKYLRSNEPTRGLSSRPMKRSYTRLPLSP